MPNPPADLVCDNCGAALVVPRDLAATSTSCAYCHGETPLPQALVQERYALHRQQLAYAEAARMREAQAGQAAHRRKMTTKILLLVILLPILIILGIIAAVFFTVMRTADRVIAEVPAAIRSTGASRSQHTSSSISITSSYTCVTGQMTLRGRSFSATAGAAVRVLGGCELTLIDCKVSGNLGVEVKGGKLTIRGGRYRTAGPAVLDSTGGRATITGGAELSGEATVTARTPSDVTLGSAVISGRSIAVKVERGATVRRGGATIRGAVAGRLID
jgi:hypothetical protein